MKKLLSIVVILCLFVSSPIASGLRNIPWKTIFVRATLMGLPVLVTLQDAVVKSRQDSSKQHNDDNIVKSFIISSEISRGIAGGILLNIFYSAIVKNK